MNMLYIYIIYIYISHLDFLFIYIYIYVCVCVDWRSTTCWFEIRKLGCHGGLTSNLARKLHECLQLFATWQGNWTTTYHNKGVDHQLDSARCPCPTSWLVYFWILSASVVFPFIRKANFSPFPRQCNLCPCSPGPLPKAFALGNAGTVFWALSELAIRTWYWLGVEIPSPFCKKAFLDHEQPLF